MKRILCLFIIVFSMFLYKNVFALDPQVKYYAYFTEPMVGEEPDDKARLVIKDLDDNVLIDDVFDIVWHSCDYGFSCNYFEEPDVFRDDLLYVFDIRDEELSNSVFSSFFIVEQYINDVLISNEIPGIYIVPLPPRKYDNTASGLVQISDISLDSKSTTTSITETPSFKDLNVSFGFDFVNKDDFAKFRVVVKNDDSIDYTLKSNSMFSDSGYVKYDLNFDDGSDIIKAGSEKTFYITAKYVKEVPEEKLNNGVYTESNNSKLVFTSEKIVNPSTNTKMFLIIGLLLIIMVGVGFVRINGKEVKMMMIVVITILMIIPISINALSEISIDVKANVKVQKAKEFCVVSGEVHCNVDGFINEKIVYYSYLPGTTFSDILVNNHRNITGLDYFFINPNGKVSFFNDYINADNFTVSNYNLNDPVLDSSQGCYVGVIDYSNDCA